MAVQADVDSNEPKLCPDPGPDQPGSESASDRAKAYQEQISRMINPQRPLPYGIVPALVNPATGDLVHYDECDEKTGDMIEAKGRGFSGLLSFSQGAESVDRKWLNQSYNEVQAAGSRQVVWYFAEQDAADYAKQLFVRQGGDREKIIIRVQPAGKP